MITLYSMKGCPYCKIVENYIFKYKLDIEIIDVMKDLRARNILIEKGGKFQTPCLFIGDEALYESLDILQWMKENL